MTMRRVGAAVAAILLTMTAAGCSVSAGGLNIGELQDLIGNDVKKLAPGETVAVACPPSVEPSAGSTFECTATIGDQIVTYTVTQSDDQGNVTYTRNMALLPLDELEDTITADLKEQAPGPWEVTCGQQNQRLIAEAPGATLTCAATEGTQAATVTVTVKDVDGNISWEAS